MSLSHRLQQQPEKATISESLSAQDYENTIQKLKLLSKAQSALLKVSVNLYE